MKTGCKKRTLVIILTAAAVMITAAVFFFQERAYRGAVRLQEQGDYVGAYQAFLRLKSWRDSGERASALQKMHPETALTAAKRWDSVFLGHFDQDADRGNGTEPLEWIVLYREEEEDGGSSMLLLSRDCLACRAYHTPVGDITWEKSGMRAYLNETFLQEAFDPQEQALIQPVRLENPGNDLLGIDGGPETEDRLFLLSAPEFSVYFQQEDVRWIYARAQATPRAQAEGIYLSGQDPENDSDSVEAGYTRWWLRSPGNEAYSAQFVEEDGNLFEGGAAVDIDYMYGLRPAMWVYTGSAR